MDQGEQGARAPLFTNSYVKYPFLLAQCPLLLARVLVNACVPHILNASYVTALYTFSNSAKSHLSLYLVLIRIHS